MLNAIKLLQEARNSFDDIIVDLTDVNNGVIDSSVQLRNTQKFALYERK
jgi:predicted membrane-bound spermidine synthase